MRYRYALLKKKKKKCKLCETAINLNKSTNIQEARQKNVAKLKNASSTGEFRLVVL